MAQQDLIDDMMRTAESIRDDLQAFHDGKVQDGDDMEMKSEEECSGDPLSLWEYLMDNLGVRYVVDGELGYEACIITMGIGGPGIWLDTWTGSIRGSWGSDRIELPLSPELVDMVDDVMRDHYDCLR